MMKYLGGVDGRGPGRVDRQTMPRLTIVAESGAAYNRPDQIMPNALHRVPIAAAFFWIALGSLVGPARAAPILTPMIAAALVALALGGRLSRSDILPVVLLAFALGLDVTGATVHPNDLAALLTLLLPWWTVRAVYPARGEVRPPIRLGLWLGCWLVVAFLLHRLWLSDSRGGLIAAGFGVLLGLWIRSERPRRFLAAAAGLGAVSLVSLMASPWLPAIRDWLRGHDAEGATWSHLLTGRPAIWRAALQAIGEFPLFGVGTGGFERLVPEVIPLAVSPVDDAHSLYLETAAAYGLPVLLAFVLLCAVALHRLYRAVKVEAAGDWNERAWNAGAFGGLAAFLVHGFGDCAAPGSTVYVAGLAAVGHALGTGPETQPRARPGRIALFALVAAIALMTIITFFSWPAERLHRRAVHAALTPGSDPALLERLAELPACAEPWWRDRLLTTAETAADVASCAPGRLRESMALIPDRADRAEAAFEARPDHPDAQLWWLRTRDAEDPAMRAKLARGYHRYLSLRPNDADVRMEFVRFMSSDPKWAHSHAALSHLAHACIHGDPGANACLGAGRLAQRLGLGHEVADSFFLASEWPGARRLATQGSGSKPE